jgi:hypothetical protein
VTTFLEETQLRGIKKLTLREAMDLLDESLTTKERELFSRLNQKVKERKMNQPTTSPHRGFVPPVAPVEHMINPQGFEVDAMKKAISDLAPDGKLPADLEVYILGTVSKLEQAGEEFKDTVVQVRRALGADSRTNTMTALHNAFVQANSDRALLGLPLVRVALWAHRQIGKLS